MGVSCYKGEGGMNELALVMTISPDEGGIFFFIPIALRPSHFPLDLRFSLLSEFRVLRQI